VTPIPGTTRDKIAQTIQIEGVPLHVVDTAGLRSSADDRLDEVERIGIERSWAEIGRADAVLVLHDLTRLTQPAYQRAQRAIDAQVQALTRAPRLTVLNKCDVAPSPAPTDDVIVVSALTGQGLDDLRAALLRIAGWQAVPEGGFIARTRHLHALRRAAEHLVLARAHVQRGDAALELLAEEMRLAHQALGEITGAFTTDDLLGEIFGRFCIGK